MSACEVTDKRIDKRSNNGRKAADLNHLIGEVHGTRIVTAIDFDRSRSVPRQEVVLTCSCGAEARYSPSAFKRGIKACKWCHNGKRSLRIPVPAERKKKRQQAYDALFGTLCGQHTIESMAEGRRPLYVLRCPEGHRFTRDAWAVISGRCKNTTCEACEDNEAIAADFAEVETEAPEVCDCRFFNGRLYRPCAWCLKQQRGAA